MPQTELNTGDEKGMSQGALSVLQEYREQSEQVRSAFWQDSGEQVVEVARTLALTLVRGGKILLCGNGGSAADAQHLAAEFVSRFEMERPPLPALALTTDSSVLTAIGNDHGFEQVFSKQVKALARKGDVLMGISTSGNSANVLQALQVAREVGVGTVGLLGRDGGEMRSLCDYVLCVPAERTAWIQEVHIMLGHMLCRLVDYFLFEAADQLQPYV